jgi:RNA-directed DNA polymerase
MWREHITVSRLADHLDRAVGESSTMGRDGQSASTFRKNQQSNLRVLNRTLRHNTHTFSAYREILKSKGAGKAPRVISLPTVRDRIVLRAMAVALNQFEPTCSIELAQGKIARVVDALKTDRYTHFLKLDVVDFYPSIDHAWLRAALTRAVGRDELTSKYMSAVETPTLSGSVRHDGQVSSAGVPQGLAISNGLAELAVAHVDHVMEIDQDIAYFRYVDDVLILMKGDRSKELWPKLEELFQFASLKIHALAGDASKSAVGAISDGFEFLGYRFEWPRVSVRKNSISRVEDSLARAFTRYKYAVEGTPRAGNWSERCEKKLEWHLNLIITGCRFEENTSGWLSYYSQIRHHQLLEHLDGLVDAQMHRQSRRGNTLTFVPKRFVDSYRFAASRKIDPTGFVPNFDGMSVDEKRTTLIEIFFLRAQDVKRMTEADVNERFSKKLRGVTKELDRDKSATGY